MARLLCTTTQPERTQKLGHLLERGRGSGSWGSGTFGGSTDQLDGVDVLAPILAETSRHTRGVEYGYDEDDDLGGDVGEDNEGDQRFLPQVCGLSVSCDL